MVITGRQPFINLVPDRYFNFTFQAGDINLAAVLSNYLLKLFRIRFWASVTWGELPENRWLRFSAPCSTRL